MAKRRSLKPAETVTAESTAPPNLFRRTSLSSTIGTALLAGTAVYVAYHPSDSVAVEQGDALWFSFLAFAIATFSFAGSGRESFDSSKWSRLLTAAVWMLAAWVMFAAFATSDLGNLRFATNEAWLWLAGAAVFSSSRRLLSDLRSQQAVLTLALSIAGGTAMHGLHQEWVSLPENREAYRQDPDRIIRTAGLDAPPGTAERMRFENRLFDGGPTATFALANSWAAVLLVGIVVCSGVLRFRRSKLSVRDGLALVMIFALCFGALVAARSRSAMLAMLIAVAWLTLVPSGASQRTRRAVLMVLTAMLAIGSIVGGMLAAFGNREWFEAAPASLAFRFQYWRSTLQMLWDRPWFGAGPGNFKAVYERYRESSATEQISDPHNFFFETLASGGWVAGVLLIVAIVAGIKLAVRKSHPDQTEICDDSMGHRGVAIGAGTSLALVWMLGWATRQVPDVEASVFVLPISIGIGILVWPLVKRIDRNPIRVIAAAVLIALMIHLCVAGGWTVPGVAIWVWIAAAMATCEIKVEGGRDPIPGVRWPAVFVGITVMVMLYFVSLRPVTQQQRWLAMAEAAQASGQIGKARISLEHAVAADPWDVTPVMWLADFYRWQLVADGNDGEARSRWIRLIEDVKNRAGADPSVYRQIGTSQLHVYQRHGRPDDLQAASKSFHEMVRLGPSNQWAMAQLAVITRALGDERESQRLAERAKTLSLAGGNLERALYLQSVYVARPMGPIAGNGPVRNPANELLEM